ncbi:ROK family transcriptional regulator [Clostridium magnum]|uniref:Glucokinase n=1 Tax=Clostridium magnum DSM 2767 TaxID=1121326 RepID=A0A161WZP6_9CLOT|nr:ROK family transcriptional regulator [Clostridium magnum]KZL92638.1 glucokinase [Clostridium magnum DSM 2767]SHI24029.1 Sugar kinase of the NBD/HSP70 family, may contain an N-terminal HTH domain [Clostridium magnum DSM 2767]
MRETLRQLSERELEILNIIHKKGMITKKNLQAITGMTLTTLNRVMKSLEDKKLIIEVGISESTGGRKAIEYGVAQTGAYVIGVDISRTYVKLIIVNLRMAILKKEEFYMNDSFSPKKTIDKITDLIEQKLLELSIDKSEVLGIGVGTVGPLDREKGIMINPKNFFNENWSNVPLKEMIERKTSIPCVIDNGANTAVLAEYLFGKGKDLKSIVYIHCGIGIRSAVITDGIIIRAMNDSEDAFAHMIIDSNGERCICGNKGCIESYSSIEAMIKRFNLKVKETNNNEEIKEEDYKKILDLAMQNNESAAEIINKGAEILGIGLANLVRIINPQLVILCGPLIKNYKLYYDMCIDTFEKINYLNNGVIFSKGGKFKEDAIAIGAAAMVVEQYIAK